MAELIGLRGNMPGINTGLSVPPVQALHDAWDTPAYALGTKFWDGERCFKYAKAGGTCIVHRAVAMNDYGISGWAVVPTATPAGSTTVYATIGAAEGAASDGAVAANSLVGGWVTIFRLNAGADNTDFTFEIAGNSAVAAGGGTCKLKIRHALPYACSVLAYTEITGNPYEDVRHITTGARMFMGQPMIEATTTYPYLWLQTWGPTWLNPETGAGADVFGNSNGFQQAVFEANGSVVMHSPEDAAGTTFNQHAGVVMTRVAGGAETQGTPLLYLQISC